MACTTVLSTSGARVRSGRSRTAARPDTTTDRGSAASADKEPWEVVMGTLQAKRFESPDEVRPFKEGKGRVALVELSGDMVGHGTFEPGWRWSEHVKPLSGTDSCQVEHIGYVLKGRMKVVMDAGDE